MRTSKILFSAALTAVAFGCTTTTEVKDQPAVVVAPPPTTKEQTPQDVFDAAVTAFDQGKLDEAQAKFEKLLTLKPDLAAAHYNLGVIAERKGDLAGAQAHYEKAQKADPKHEPTLLNLGKVYRLQDKFEQAIALYEAALKEPGNEFNVPLLNNLTVAYRLAKKFDLAEQAARKVLSRTKDNPDAYKNLALVYFDQGNYRLAEFISANAKKLDEKDPGVWNNLGMIYLRMDDRLRALGHFQKSVTLKSDFAPGLFNLGAMSLSFRDYENAEKSLHKVTELDPTSYEGFLAYAWALDGQKGRDPKKGLAAGQAFEKVLSLKAEQPDAVCGAGWAYAAEKTGFDKAVPYLQKCRSLASSTPQEQQLIDAKLKSIETLRKAGAAAQAPAAAPKDKPKPAANPSGASLLDKVTDDAAKSEPTPAPETAPAPTPAPEASPAPAK